MLPRVILFYALQGRDSISLEEVFNRLRPLKNTESFKEKLSDIDRRHIAEASIRTDNVWIEFEDNRWVLHKKHEGDSNKAEEAAIEVLMASDKELLEALKAALALVTPPSSTTAEKEMP